MSPFKDLKIMCIGEICVDKYLEGVSNRNSPEQLDVPIVNDLKVTVKRPGMIGNLAQNLESLGAEVGIFSITGADAAAEWLEKQFYDANLMMSQFMPTIVKKRLIINGEHVARIDRETNREYQNLLQFLLVEIIAIRMQQFDAVVIQDYGKGLWNTKMLQVVMDEARKHNKKVFVDPWGLREVSAYKGAYLIKPNAKEAAQLVNGDGNAEWNNALAIYEATKALVLLTRGSQGIVACAYGDTYYQFTTAQSPVDVCGAGDTALAVLTLGLTKGWDLSECMKLANKAAGLSIQKKGPATVTWEELNAEAH